MQVVSIMKWPEPEERVRGWQTALDRIIAGLGAAMGDSAPAQPK